MILEAIASATELKPLYVLMNPAAYRRLLQEAQRFGEYKAIVRVFGIPIRVTRAVRPGYLIVYTKKKRVLIMGY